MAVVVGLELPSDPGQGLFGGQGRGVRQQDAEFVAAHAGDDVLQPEGRLQDVGRPAEEHVAGGVPLGVVGPLQTVQVEHHDADGIVEAPLQSRQLRLEREAVPEARQRVVAAQEP